MGRGEMGMSPPGLAGLGLLTFGQGKQEMAVRTNLRGKRLLITASPSLAVPETVDSRPISIQQLTIPTAIGPQNNGLLGLRKKSLRRADCDGEIR